MELEGILAVEQPELLGGQEGGMGQPQTGTLQSVTSLLAKNSDSLNATPGPTRRDQEQDKGLKSK